MKKILVFILAFIFIIAFCGCGTIEEGSSDAEKTSVFMYEFNGNVVQKWSDVRNAYGSGDEVWIYLNNGDYIEIYNAPVVIVEE